MSHELIFQAAGDPERSMRLLVLKLLAVFLAVSTFFILFLLVPWWTGFPLLLLLTIFSASIIISAATSPIVQFCKLRNVPPALTICALALIFISGLVLIALNVVPVLTGQARMIVGQLQLLLQTQVPLLWLHFKPLLSQWFPTVAPDIDNLVGEGVKAATNYAGYVATFADIIANFLTSIATLSGYSIFALIACYYFTTDPALLKWPAEKCLPRQAERINAVIASVYVDIGRWARWQMGLSIFFGCGFGLWLELGQYLLGGQWNAATIGLLGGFVDVLPFGNTLAIGMAGLIQMSQGNWFGLLWVIGGAFVVIEIEWHILAPQTMGHALRIHPLVILSAVFTGFLWKNVLGGMGAIPVLIVLGAIFKLVFPNQKTSLSLNEVLVEHRFFKWRNRFQRIN